MNGFQLSAGELSDVSQKTGCPDRYAFAMSAKYYTHFIAQADESASYSEYRGVVEFLDRPTRTSGKRDVARVLAQSFDLEESEIQVLQWHQLH